MKALSKEGKLNKSVLKFILQDMLAEKKMNKTEMKLMLKKLADDSILSQRDSDEMVEYIKGL
jgi:hypothetical protein